MHNAMQFEMQCSIFKYRSRNYIQISEISELSELSSKNVGHSNISLRIFENKHLAIIIIHNILCICMYNTIYRYILTLIFFIFLPTSLYYRYSHRATTTNFNDSFSIDTSRKKEFEGPWQLWILLVT